MTLPTAGALVTTVVDGVAAEATAAVVTAPTAAPAAKDPQFQPLSWYAQHPP